MTSDVRHVDAPAKINLFLRILHRRTDGFREVETLFQSVALADRVEVECHEADSPTIDLSVEGADLGAMEDNLAWRAARDFLEATGARLAVDLRLRKRIPAGAGLGGGSSDAAAVLRCLADRTGFPDHEALLAMAARLGSDVPFFLGERPLALGRGRGEVLTPLPALPARPVVLALPPVHVSTVGAYGALAASRGSREVDPHGGPRTLALGGADWSKVEALAENDFEPIVCDLHGEVAASLDGLRRRGAVVALLSGSGAASFGLFDDAQVAGEAAERLTAEMGWAFVATETLTESSPVRCAV